MSTLKYSQYVIVSLLIYNIYFNGKEASFSILGWALDSFVVLKNAINPPVFCFLQDMALDPGEDVALLSVSFEDPEATQVFPKLYLSPSIEQYVFYTFDCFVWLDYH